MSNLFKIETLKECKIYCQYFNDAKCTHNKLEKGNKFIFNSIFNTIAIHHDNFTDRSPD